MAGLDDDFSPEAVLKFSQQMRRKVVNHLSKNGTEFPPDPESNTVLLRALKDSDAVALTTQRLALDGRIASNEHDIAKQYIQRIHQEVGSKDIYRAATPTQRDLGLPDDPAPNHIVNQDTLHVGVADTKYDDFMERSDPDNQA